MYKNASALRRSGKRFLGTVGEISYIGYDVIKRNKPKSKAGERKRIYHICVTSRCQRYSICDRLLRVSKSFEIRLPCVVDDSKNFCTIGIAHRRAATLRARICAYNRSSTRAAHAYLVFDGHIADEVSAGVVVHRPRIYRAHIVSSSSIVNGHSTHDNLTSFYSQETYFIGNKMFRISSVEYSFGSFVVRTTGEALSPYADSIFAYRMHSFLLSGSSQTRTLFVFMNS